MKSKKDFDFRLTVGKAERFIQELGITELPVDPYWIAQSKGIFIQEKPASSAGVSGMLIRSGDEFGIAYATHIESEGFKKFSVAHELGHYRLPGHIDYVLPKGQDIHESHSGFISSDRYELEADHFAAALLMPNPLFSKAMNKEGEGLDAIVSLAGLCRTSLTATAIRYVECADVPVAMIMSTLEKIDYCFMSGSLREFQDLDWIRKGVPIPKGTATLQFNQNPERVARAEKNYGTPSLQDWFGGDRDMELSEEVVGLGSYGKTLTILSLVGDIEDFDDDAEIDDSLVPRFRR